MKRLLSILLFAAAASNNFAASPAMDRGIAEKVSRSLKNYSRYSIWDHVAISVHEGTIDITGSVTRAYKKDEVERMIARIDGVKSVSNRLIVLPRSFADENLRNRVGRAIYGDLSARSLPKGMPRVHVIVNNGAITLEGFVINEEQKEDTVRRASEAAGSSHTVVNNLRVVGTQPMS